MQQQPWPLHGETTREIEMLIYQVTYPNSRDCDNGVGWDYLRRLAENPKRDGAEAVCLNGEAATLVLVGGEWVEKTNDQTNGVR